MELMMNTQVAQLFIVCVVKVLLSSDATSNVKEVRCKLLNKKQK